MYHSNICLEAPYLMWRQEKLPYTYINFYKYYHPAKNRCIIKFTLKYYANVRVLLW